jgi:hypothetical protein
VLRHHREKLAEVLEIWKWKKVSEKKSSKRKAQKKKRRKGENNEKTEKNKRKMFVSFTKVVAHVEHAALRDGAILPNNADDHHSGARAVRVPVRDARGRSVYRDGCSS